MKKCNRKNKSEYIKNESCRVTQCITINENGILSPRAASGAPGGAQNAENEPNFSIFKALWRPLADFGQHLGPGGSNWRPKGSKMGGELKSSKSMAKSVQKPMHEKYRKTMPE